MKTEIVRARIDAQLKAQATTVLASHDLEISAAIRLFLQEVVRGQDLPFAAEIPLTRVSAKKLWAMKRKAQKRDHELVASGAVPAESMLLISPKQIRGATVKWPKALK